MARKETIYTVDKETNTVIRASRSLLAALDFLATIPVNSAYICTSEFGDLKRGDAMSSIVDFLA